MRLDTIPQPWVRGALARIIASGRIAHAYLFVGDAGLGTEDAARGMVAALLCAQPDDGGACGQCPACRKTAAGNHPDVLWMTPAGTSFKTDQVATVIRELRYRPVEGRLRCAVLVGADTMTDEAANRLLKTLEEPPGQAVLFLLASDPERLPETIRSRCQRILFRPLNAAEIARQLVDEGLTDPGRAHRLALWSRGNPGRARMLAEHEQLDTLYEAVRTGLERVVRGDPLAALETAEEWAAWDPADLELALDIGEATRIAAWREGEHAVDPEAVLAAFARARHRLEARVGAQSVLDALFLELGGLRA